MNATTIHPPFWLWIHHTVIIQPSLDTLLVCLLQWKKGQPRPQPAHSSISHPGLKQSVPQLSPQLTKPNTVPAGEATQAATGARDSNASTRPVNPAAAEEHPAARPEAAASRQPAEPNADMAVPQGSEHNLNGDKPQRWCQARHAAAAGAGSRLHVSSRSGKAAGQVVGHNQGWFNVSLPTMNVLVSMQAPIMT